MLQAHRLLTCRRASATLESVIAATVLVAALACLCEVVRVFLVDDMLQRAAYRVARANALHESAASDQSQLRSRVMEAVTAELGEMLDFDLAENGSCSTTDDDGNAIEQSEFCLAVSIEIYDDPSAMQSDTQSTGDNADVGGDAGDMAVVRLHLVPQTTLGKTQQKLFGDGLRAMAVVRNERLQDA